jgi:CheY-like chemotaxis protein
VLEASSGVEALSLWKDRGSEVQLLVTDIVMPEGISGRDLTNRLRTERPKLNVVFTSGYDPDKAGLEAELGNGTNFLPKPYSPQKLLKAVRESLDLKRESNAALVSRAPLER